MKDGRHDVALQLHTPQKLPVSFGIFGAQKDFRANFDYIICYFRFA